LALSNIVVRCLTGDQDAFHDIWRRERTGFQLMVRTAASREEPLPIQYASQGTLSILAIFGLIYSYLHQLDPNAKWRIESD
jgi:hypothetical protein